VAREPDKPEGRPEVVAWWMICLCRAEEQRFEAMTVTCCGGEALALFGHVEEA
jgi:hypothetical protein